MRGSPRRLQGLGERRLLLLPPVPMMAYEPTPGMWKRARCQFCHSLITPYATGFMCQNINCGAWGEIESIAYLPADALHPEAPVLQDP